MNYSTNTISRILLFHLPNNLRLFLVFLLDKNFYCKIFKSSISFSYQEVLIASLQQSMGWLMGWSFSIILIYKTNIPREFMGLMFTLKLVTCNIFSQCRHLTLTTSPLQRKICRRQNKTVTATRSIVKPWAVRMSLRLSTFHY